MRKEDLSEKSFVVLSICREDLIEEGYPKKEVEKLTDEQMNHLADKMGNAIMDSYWTALEIGAEYLLHLKKKKK